MTSFHCQLVQTPFREQTVVLWWIVLRFGWRAGGSEESHVDSHDFIRPSAAQSTSPAGVKLLVLQVQKNTCWDHPKLRKEKRKEECDVKLSAVIVNFCRKTAEHGVTCWLMDLSLFEFSFLDLSWSWPQLRLKVDLTDLLRTQIWTHKSRWSNLR